MPLAALALSVPLDKLETSATSVTLVLPADKATPARPAAKDPQDIRASLDLTVPMVFSEQPAKRDLLAKLVPLDAKVTRALLESWGRTAKTGFSERRGFKALSATRVKPVRLARLAPREASVTRAILALAATRDQPAPKVR